jgi:hypothetical protein
MVWMSDLFVRIAQVRQQLFEIEQALREVGATKSHGRMIADLRERANELEAEVYRAVSEVNFEVKKKEAAE